MPPGSGAVRGTAVSRTLLLDRVGWNMAFLKPKQAPVPQVDFERLPRHVAIIMDGNGRWAKKRGLPRTAGHAAGAETFRTIATYCKDIGLEYLTVYAFSTENCLI